MAAFADKVPVPVRDVNGDVAFHHGLASEARVELIVGSLLHAIEFVIVHLGKIRCALLYNHMTGCAGAVPTTRVFEMKAVVHRHIEQRFGLAMTFIGKLTFFELEGFIGGQKRNFRQFSV